MLEMIKISNTPSVSFPPFLEVPKQPTSEVSLSNREFHYKLFSTAHNGQVDH